MKVTSREFLRKFSEMKAKAAEGVTITVVSKGSEFEFKALKRRSWQGALEGKMMIKGDIFSTGIEWDAMR